MLKIRRIIRRLHRLRRFEIFFIKIYSFICVIGEICGQTLIFSYSRRPSWEISQKGWKGFSHEERLFSNQKSEVRLCHFAFPFYILPFARIHSFLFSDHERKTKRHHTGFISGSAHPGCQNAAGRSLCRNAFPVPERHTRAETRRNRISRRFHHGTILPSLQMVM